MKITPPHYSTQNENTLRRLKERAQVKNKTKKMLNLYQSDSSIKLQQKHMLTIVWVFCFWDCFTGLGTGIYNLFYHLFAAYLYIWISLDLPMPTFRILRLQHVFQGTWVLQKREHTGGSQSGSLLMVRLIIECFYRCYSSNSIAVPWVTLPNVYEPSLGVITKYL